MKPIIEQRGLRAQAAAKYCGLGRSTFLRYVAEGRAPAPRRLSPGSVIWLSVKQRAKVSSIGVETASKLTTCYPAGFDRRHLE